MADRVCLARFADESRRVKPAGLAKLFEPHRKSRSLSLFTTTDAPEQDVLDAGRYAAKNRKRERLYGWQWACKEVFEGLRLSVDIDGNPTIGKCRHVNVTGWPSDEQLELPIVHALIEKLAPEGLFKLPSPVASGYAKP